LLKSSEFCSQKSTRIYDTNSLTNPICHIFYEPFFSRSFVDKEYSNYSYIQTVKMSNHDFPNQKVLLALGGGDVQIIANTFIYFKNIVGFRNHSIYI